MNNSTMHKALLKLDHCRACRTGGACDCPSVGESLAELAHAVHATRSAEVGGTLPPWATEADRASFVADAIGELVRFVATNGLPPVGVIAARALCSGDVGFARDLGSARLAWTVAEARALYGAMCVARERFGAAVEPSDFGFGEAPHNVAEAVAPLARLEDLEALAATAFGSTLPDATAERFAQLGFNRRDLVRPMFADAARDELARRRAAKGLDR